MVRLLLLTLTGNEMVINSYKLLEIIMMTSINFLTLPYNCVTISFLPEIWFWGPTHPTFLYDVTLFSLFFLLMASLNCSISFP